MKALPILLITLSSLSLATTTLPARNVKIGTTYAIVEPDAMQEIESQAAQAKWDMDPQTLLEKASVFQSIALPVVETERERWYIPASRTEFDIPDQHGRIIYPKGFAFNPLDYFQIPGRMVIFSQPQVAFIAPHVTATDTLILTEGNVLQVMQTLQRHVFLLDAPLKTSLNVTAVPSIIEQRGNALHIQELNPNIPTPAAGE